MITSSPRTKRQGFVCEEPSYVLHSRPSKICGVQALDVFLAGDDIKSKKPDPEIYVVAARKLGLDPSECLVVEDSSIGLQVGFLTIVPYDLFVPCDDYCGANAGLTGWEGGGRGVAVRRRIVLRMAVGRVRVACVTCLWSAGVLLLTAL